MTKRKLSDNHLAELRASGLNDETISLAGLYTETSSTDICRILNCNNPAMINGTEALVFPFGYDRFIRLKLDNPRLRNGSRDKVIKYESPWGSKQHPYFPPDTFDEISKHETEKEIFIVEGEKKALKLWQEFRDNDIDAFVIGITGVYGWKEKQQERLVDWLDNIHWTNRIVYICFDNDVHWNQNVADARGRFALVLKGHGANVKSIDIPITDPSLKFGVDDYIVKYGINAWFDCLAKAKHVDVKDVIKLEIISASSVEIVPVEWLWKLYVPLGEITLLDGNPGLGKSQMVADISARVSKGFAMPPNDSCLRVTQTGNVLMLCAEDTIEKTVKPRLQVCQANMHKVYFMKASGKPLSFPKDIDRFEQECIELDIVLVVIDPIMSYISGDIDTHSDQSTREVLNRLKEFAEHTNIAIIMLRHLNKKRGDAAIFRGGGSIAFTAASRSNLIVGNHPTEEGINVLACVKSNLDVMPKSISYSIMSVETKYGSIGRIDWLDETKIMANDIVDIEKGGKKTNKIDKCVGVIIDMLQKNGPMQSLDLQQMVIDKIKTSPSTYQHARKRCSLIRSRPPADRKSGKWWSKLPGQRFSWEVGKKSTRP